MTLDISKLETATFENTQQWDTRDVIHYALACGYAQEGVSTANLRYIYERELYVAPSFATMIARNGTPSLTELGGDYSKSVLASVSASFHAPMPVSGEMRVSTTITGVVDKGSDRGAIVGLETKVHDANQYYATVATCLMARADGGCGSFGSVPRNKNTPDTTPDETRPIYTRPDQAALYRLLGDINPLHIDPVAASASGFAQPIMHGLCTYGIAYRGLSEIFNRPIETVSTRLSAPVFPGETLNLKIWNTDNAAHFELQSIVHDRNVLSAGFITFSN